MRINLVRSIGIVLGLAAILVLVALPTLAAAPMDYTETHDMGTCQQRAAIPLHCSHCILTNTNEVAKQVLPPNRLTTSENVDLSLSPTNLSTESSPNKGMPVQGDTIQASPPSPLVEYHCRNLDSEEPPL